MNDDKLTEGLLTSSDFNIIKDSNNKEDDSIKIKTILLIASLVLLSNSIMGFQKGVDINNVTQFFAFLMLAAVYHFWFKGNGGKVGKH